MNPVTALVLANDGNFYGTTLSGGIAYLGTVFRLTPAGAVTILHEFTGLGSDGAYPQSALIRANDGSLYGVTTVGGEHSYGTVFKVSAAGIVSTLYSFDGNPAAYPIGALVQGDDDNLYGTTSASLFGSGIAFRITFDGAMTILHVFNGGAGDGARPLGDLVQVAQKFYGTTELGGSADVGTIFQMTSEGVVTLLHSFDGTDGSFPRSGLTAAEDGLYGVALAGGDSGEGTAFRIATDGTDFTLLHAFTSIGEGGSPVGTLIQSGGLFYGVTQLGGASAVGTVFQMTAAGVVTALHEFSGSDGSYPSSGVILAGDGTLCGVTPYGGALNAGTAFTLTTGGSFALLHSFDAGSDGARPRAPLILGADGNFYGTTELGGAANLGTVFRMTPSGAVTILYGFLNTGDGVSPTGVVQGVDGAFYGASGTMYLFKLTGGGAFSVLHVLDPSEGSSPNMLIQATDGNFYGTALNGGEWDGGTIFRMTPDGGVTVLHSFQGNGDGMHPTAPLVQATDGNLYGTTQGGSGDPGSAFKIALDGTFTLLHSFTNEGEPSRAPLIQGSDGNFYGTLGVTPSGEGSAFRMTPAGAVTTLHTFAGSPADGGSPDGALVQAPSGILFGTTVKGGASNAGVVFQLTLSGEFTILHSFTGADGSNPHSGLVQMGADNFFGTTLYGNGPGPLTGGGMLFHLSTFTDDPIVAGSTVVRAIHVIELRSRIDALRARFGVPAYSYADPVLVADASVMRAQHVLDLRAALAEVYIAAGAPAPAYSDPDLRPGRIIRAVHLLEIRAAVVALE